MDARAGCYRFSDTLFYGSHFDSARKQEIGTGSALLELRAVDAPGSLRKGFPNRRAVRAPAFITSYGVPNSYESHSYWESRPGDSVRIFWGGMMGGESFKLAVRGDSLVGTYTASSDLDGHFIRRGDSAFIAFNPPKVLRINAVQTACPVLLDQGE